MNRLPYYEAMDAAIKDAEALMNMTDVADSPEEDYESAYEERYHCNICVVRSVMETVWPSVEAYITALEDEVDRLTTEK